ncbi:MAG TPA: hypothetical protein VGO50_15670 [Pyrinomonadaceae bacterium]|jgi:hypothetical protein|nr:hypothetical protein [Pyrinomonadaceae bacterium]
MKISNKFIAICGLALAFIVMQACSLSTANMSSFKTSSDKDGKTETTSFKGGDTLNARAEIANSISKVTVKFALVAEDVKGMTKGETVKGSEVKVDLPSSGTATYSLPIPMGAPGGTYKLNADMINEAGEKKDGKTVSLTLAQSAPPAAPAEKKADDDDAEDKDDK